MRLSGTDRLKFKFQCVLTPPCTFEPCAELNLTCVDLTMNGTNYNESTWGDFMAEEYDMELDNATYGYQCIDQGSAIPIPDPIFSNLIPNPNLRSQIFKIPGILGFIVDPCYRPLHATALLVQPLRSGPDLSGPHSQWYLKKITGAVLRPDLIIAYKSMILVKKTMVHSILYCMFLSP